MKCELDDNELDLWIAAAVMGYTDHHRHSGPIVIEDLVRAPGEKFISCSAYSTKLDACAQAEAKIASWHKHAKYLYLENLEKIVLGYSTYDDRLDAAEEFEMVTATARQRCEAMWMTQNKIEALKV